MTDDLERRLRPFNPDDHEAECAREALAELSEVLSLRGMARRNAASEFLSDFEAILRSALSTADEIARLRAENEALREALAKLRDLPIEENDEPDTLHLRGSAHQGPVVDWTFSVIRKIKEIARQALQEGSRHE